MTGKTRKITLNSADATTDLAERIGATLQPGDCVLLEGSIGAGKTHFARSLIQSLLLAPEDVPSPTFTLVQTYGTSRGEVWHADLYRLSSPEDIEELGLTDAFESAICLVEWPDRLGDLIPSDAMTLSFAADDTREDTRHLVASWKDPRWDAIWEKPAHG